MKFSRGMIAGKYPLKMPDFRVQFHAERPWWERSRLESMAELVQEGDVVFDIGAEHGDFTALYRKWVGPDGDVIPIEPAAHYWPFIRATWEENLPPEYRVPRYAFHGLCGDVIRQAAPDGQACAGVWPDASYGEGVPDGGFLHWVAAPDSRRTTVDHVAQVVEPDALVIDVEGAEWNVLKGAELTLWEHRPTVWVSVHPTPLGEWYGKTPADIYAFMRECEYAGHELESNGEGEEFHLFTWNPDADKEEPRVLAGATA